MPPTIFRKLLLQWPVSILICAIGVFNGVVIVPKYRNELNLEGLVGSGIMDADIHVEMGLSSLYFGLFGIPLVLAIAAILRSISKPKALAIGNAFLIWISPMMNTLIVAWLVWCHAMSLLTMSTKASEFRDTLKRAGLYVDVRESLHQKLLSQRGGWLSRATRPSSEVGPIESLSAEKALGLLKYQTDAAGGAQAMWVAFHQVRPLLELYDVLQDSHADSPELKAALEAARKAASKPFKDWEEVRAWQNELLKAAEPEE
jgi:hypothetical protein